MFHDTLVPFAERRIIKMRFIPESNITAKEVSNENFMPKIDIDKNGQIIGLF